LKNYYKSYQLFFILMFFFFAGIPALKAQQDRFSELEKRLSDLSVTNPGLKEKTKFSVSGASLAEFLRGIAEAHNLNINVDPSLNMRITNNFQNEKVMNVLLFLAREYNLDCKFIGSIISFSIFQSTPIVVIPKIKVLQISFNSSQNTLSFDLNNDSLMSVVKKISQLSGKNIDVGHELTGKTIDAFAQDIQFQSALEKIAFSNHLKLTKTTDGTYVIDPLADDEVLIARKDPEAQSAFVVRKSAKSTAANPVSVDVSTAGGRKLVKVNAVNTPIIDLIKSVAEEAQINYFIYSDVKGTLTANFSNISFNSFLTLAFQGTSYTYKEVKGVYLIGERAIEGLRDHQIVQLQNRSIDSVQIFIPQEMKKGVEIKEFKELNSFLLTGSSPQIAEVMSFIKSIDKPVPMVTIEVIIVDIKKNRSTSTGISAGTADSVKTGGTILPGLNYTFGSKSINSFLNILGTNNIINLGKVMPNFYVKLSALEQNNNVDIRQTPKLTTLNGHVANLSIGNTRYYTTTTQNVLGSLSTQTVVTQQFTPVEANLAIDIKPVVSGDEQVTLNIDVKIADFTETPLIGPPPTSTSKFKSIIRVRNQDMVVLGGLERTERNDSGSGTPLLSRIPILKWFFGSRNKSTTKTVSIIFIRPTIQY